MRHKIVTYAVAGVLGATTVALAGPALAADSPASAAAAATSRVDRIKQALAGLVTDKTLTQAQADKVASALGAADLGRGQGGGHRGHGPGGRPGLAAAATTLKMTEAELRAELDHGKTLAQVAKEQSVSVDTLVAALVKAEKAHLAQAVADGRITQAQADKHLADLTERVTARVNSPRPPRPGRAPDATPGSPSTTTTPAPTSTTT